VSVTNSASEPEALLVFDDLITIQSGGFKLAERLAAHCWDLTNPDYKAVLGYWQESAADKRRQSLSPS